MLKKAVVILLMICCHHSLVAQTPYMDSLMRIIALQKHDTIELAARNNLTNEFIRHDLQRAKQLALQTTVLAAAKKEFRLLSGSYNYLTTIYRLLGRLDSAKYYMEQSEKLVRSHPQDQRMKFNFNQSTSLFYKNTGDFKKALPYMLENLDINKAEDENKAGQLLNLGNLYSNMGEHKKATEAHLQSLRLFEKVGNLKGQSYVLHSLGIEFFVMKQFGSAQKYFERSYQLKEKLGDKRGMLTTTISMGDVAKAMNQFTRAHQHYQSALTTATQMKMPSEEALVLHQLGLLYAGMQEPAKARESFTKSREIWLQTGDSVSAIKTKSELVGLDLAELRKKNVETELLRDLHTIIQAGDRQQEAIEYQRLSEYYTLHKDYEKALLYLKKHLALSDSVQGKGVLLQLKELEEQYNSEKKQQEIELLKKDQQLQAMQLDRQQANTTSVIVLLISVIIIGALLLNRYRVLNRVKRQAELEKMRQNIARDLHDSIGSTLSSINIMSQVAMKENNGNSVQLQKIASYSSGMMESMSDMVWSINPRNDSVEQMMAKMKEFAAEILEPKNISYDFRADAINGQVKLDVTQRKNLFLIFKEAVNNAAKYSEASMVVIDIRSEYGSLLLQIQDNGKGFDEEKIVRGNGLINMAERAQSIHGVWNQTTAPGRGTVISVRVPIT